MRVAPPRAVAIAAVVLASLALALPRPGLAHWCDDLWGSSYNIVVRPATDTVPVPDDGSETFFVIWVQNNMGYPLVNFNLAASATGYNVRIDSRAATTVTNYLMPGENLRHTLAISRADGTDMGADLLEFSVSFGNSVQDSLYSYQQGKDTMTKMVGGGLVPTPAPDLGAAHSQALQLGAAQVADFGTTADGLDDLMQIYCCGRGSWATGGAIMSQYCEDTSSTSCPAAVSRGHTKWDYQHLWAAEFLAARKAGMSPARIATFRERLQCGYDDSHLTFKAMAAMALGYLGEDAGARSFLEGEISGGSSDEQAIAKAALLLLGDAGDRSAYRADVVAGLGHSNEVIECASAAALGIIDGDDDAVTDHLVAKARWTQPETGNNGTDFYCAHLLDLVAWDRRGWAPNAGDTGAVSFFGGDTVPPAAPSGVTCAPGANGSARIDWNQVTQDDNGDPETVDTYRVYYGSSSRPGGATRPGEQGFDYDHVQSTGSIYANISSLAEGQTAYFAVTAVDPAQNHSVYSVEVPCDIPVTNDPPVAALTCSPSSGEAPLDVTCDATASSDPDGAGDIATYYFDLDSGGEVEEADGIIDYSFSSAGAHTVVVRVVDQGGLDDTASDSIQVNAHVNQAPTAVVAATPESGEAPLDVAFSSTGSSDPDGDNISFSWSFDDGSPADTSANPNHSFTAPGSYLVTLTVTDDGAPPLSGTDVIAITVSEPASAPVAVLDCSPASGEAPLDVTCSGTASTDPNGAGDIAHYYFRLDGQAEVDEVDGIALYNFSGAGAHTVALRVVDQGGLEDSASTSVTVTAPSGQNQPPEAVATGTPTSGTAPLQVSFDATGSTDPDGDNISFSWSFDDGSAPDTSAAPLHTFTAPGSYLVSVTVTDDGSPPLTAVASLGIEVQAPSTAPTAVLSCAPLAGTAPLDVTCDGLASSDPDGAADIASYSFSLDGQAAVDEADGQISYSFSSSGNHTVLLRVTDQGGLSDTDSASIQVGTSSNQPPVAVATASPESGAVPLEVLFSSAGSLDPDGDSISFAWDFDDGSAVDSSADPVHSYLNAGSYSASLTVSDDGNPPLTAVAVVVVTVSEVTNNPPVLTSASASPLFGPAPLSVHFDASGVFDPEGDGFTLSWDFDDGSPLEGAAAVDHTFASDGQYHVLLSAQDDGVPALPPASRAFDISVTSNSPPDVGPATVAPLAGQAPLTITMDASACDDPDGDNVSVLWTVELSMDESANYQEAVSSHTLTEEGTYDVTLILTDDADVSLEATRVFQVRVSEPAQAGDGGASRVTLSEGFACASSSPTAPVGCRNPAALAAALVLLGALRRRRRRVRLKPDRAPFGSATNPVK